MDKDKTRKEAACFHTSKSLRVFSLMMFLAVALIVKADFKVYNFSGAVSIVGGKNITKGMVVRGIDQFEIGKGGMVEIINTADSKIYKCNKPGKYSATAIMLNAAKSSDSSLASVNNATRFSKNPKGVTVYQEGCRVTRALDSFDPEAADRQVDGDYLARCLVQTIKGETASDVTQLTVEKNRCDSCNLEFKIVNTLSFPVYINVVMAEGNELSISHIGQPVGCYILLPGQSITRSHSTPKMEGERHFLVATHCYFDIDNVLEKANAMLSADPDGLSVSVDDLYIIEL